MRCPPPPLTACRGAKPAARLAAWACALQAGMALAQMPPEATREIAVRLSGSVLRVEAPRPQGGYALGSGVVVGEQLVVTNCHVTRDSARLSVLRGGVRWRVTAQLADPVHDLCLLQAPGMVAPVVPLADDSQAPLIGQPVMALGYTGGLDLQHSFGEVVDLHRLGDGSVLQTSNGFNSGASGGGLFDAGGRLVGILTFRLRGGEQHYFAGPVRWVQRLVQRASAGGLQPVAALDPAQRPYWQDQGALQPSFLRASALLREQRWDDLAGLARRWLLDDPGDGEPWYLLGLALDRLAQPAAARQAFDCALRLQPQRAMAAVDPSGTGGLAAAAPPATPPSATTPTATPPTAAPPPGPGLAAAGPLPDAGGTQAGGATPSPQRLAGAMPCPSAA